jgi:uncharacterized protein (TIGR00288 family)
MASLNDSVSMALFCDFENVALGVRDAKYEKFDIKPVLERLLVKGSIVVKKAYCDWERYKGFKSSMHEASFELIEIPHVRQSGKNSADIRLVVDALDLCYTKSHVDTFVIISGDSDFSPLVSKLRENAKKVIGVGVKNSTSDLLVANCDEFIFYDDLVREQQRAIAKREARAAQSAAKRTSDKEKPQPKTEMDARKAKAVAIAVETFEALASERGESDKIWASVLKSAIKRRKPDFSESYYGFRAFGNLLEEAQARGLLEVGRDDKSGAFVYRASHAVAPEPVVSEFVAQQPGTHEAAPSSESEAGLAVEPQSAKRGKKHGRGARKPGRQPAAEASAAASMETAAQPEDEETPFFEPAPEAVEDAQTSSRPHVEDQAEAVQTAGAASRRGRKTAAKKARTSEARTSAGQRTGRSRPEPGTAESSAVGSDNAAAEPDASAPAAKKPARAARKSGARSARARKPAAEPVE